ncbi:MAG: glycogen synthase GlgA [Acidobacteria bacterium]|nr:glycogen synthase GlgA [Acidobacteriota bacterium]
MRILFVAPECLPFSKTGGLADVVGALPRVLAARGHEATVFLPRYRRTQPGTVVLPRLVIPLGPQLHPVAIQQGPTLGGVRVLLVDYPLYFDRDGLYVDGGTDYPDNAERFTLLCRAALEFVKQEAVPDLIHCHDWQSALVPVLLKTLYADEPRLGRVPTVFTVHNLGYQGFFLPDVLDRIGLPGRLFSVDALEFYGRVNFLKGGLVFADFVTTVSKGYAEEIQTPEYGHGLDGVIRARRATVTGIVNGVDYTEWNPEADKFLAANYSVEKLDAKLVCKKDLLQQFKLPADDLTTPVIGMVSRFATQKGFDLIAEVAGTLMEDELKIVALGTGEPHYEELFRQLAQRFPQKMAVRVAYDNTLAHKIEGGSDIFLMPSRYEPCGLNQIYSLRYGTVPVVRATGGLDDTIEPFDPSTGQGTGFKFTPYSGTALLDCLRQALDLYHGHPRAWQRLMRNGMHKDFSWNHSAAEYEQLYERVVKSAQRK